LASTGGRDAARGAGLRSRHASSARDGARSEFGLARAVVSHLPAYVTVKEVNSSG
jgi:hypothetical protein